MKVFRPYILLLSLLTIVSGFSLSSCRNTNKSSKKTEKQELTEELLEETSLDIVEPLLIDSSDFILYPLVLDNQVDVLETKTEDKEPVRNYWNIIFHNVSSGSRHLLDEKRKMVISSISQKDGKIQAIQGRLFYLITIKDYNNDGYLNSEDPKYLFVSDLNGKNFGQISPDNLHVQSWKYVAESNKIFLQMIKDSDSNEEFESDDEIIPMVYEIGSIGFAKEVFSREYKTELKKVYLNQWE